MLVDTNWKCQQNFKFLLQVLSYRYHFTAIIAPFVMEKALHFIKYLTQI